MFLFLPFPETGVCEKKYHLQNAFSSLSKPAPSLVNVDVHVRAGVRPSEKGTIRVQPVLCSAWFNIDLAGGGCGQL